MKKESVCFLLPAILIVFLLVGVFSSNSVLVSASTDSLESTTEGIQGKAEDAQENLEKAEKVADDLGKKKWNYLGDEWKKIFLSNKYVSGLDSFLNHISILFFILFARNYSLSIGLLVLIVIWIFFLVKFYQILRDFSMFSEGTSFIIGFAMVVALAHVGLFQAIVSGLDWLLLWKESWWIRSLIMAGSLILLIVVSTLSKTLGQWYQKEQEKDEKEQEKMNRKFLQKFSDAIRNGISGD